MRRITPTRIQAISLTRPHSVAAARSQQQYVLCGHPTHAAGILLVRAYCPCSLPSSSLTFPPAWAAARKRRAAGGGWWEYVGLNDGPPADVVRVVRMLVARARVACVHACAQSPSTRIAVVKWRSVQARRKFENLHESACPLGMIRLEISWSSNDT